MSVISPSVPEGVAITGYRTVIMASIRSLLEGLNGRLFAGRADEFFRSLDEQTREDFGVTPCERDVSADEHSQIPEGLLREIFSWARFSK